jgi:hypothetical protein
LTSTAVTSRFSTTVRSVRIRPRPGPDGDTVQTMPSSGMTSPAVRAAPVLSAHTDGSAPGSPQVRAAVEQHLGAGVAWMWSSAGVQPEESCRTGHGDDAVGSARGCGDHVMDLGVVVAVVDPDDDGEVSALLARRSALCAHRP